MTASFEMKKSVLPNPRAQGFSLIELMVALAVFLVVSIASLSLFSRHETMLSREQGVSGLNIGLRSALSQIQIDTVNAGNGQIAGPEVPAWPVGVTISNSNPTASQCYTAATFSAANVMLTAPNYASACFDTLNIVMVDASTPPVHPMTSTGACITTSSNTSFYGAMPSGYASSTYATNFQNGDQVIFVSATAPTKYTTALLTANGSSTTCASLGSIPSCSTSYPSGFASLSYHITGSGGTNTVSNDPISMTVNAPTSELSASFCSSDWVLRMKPITYSVITTATVNGIEDPQLVRAQAGTTNVVMDQVIGFKVGAAWWDNNTSTFAYCYNTGAYCDNADTIPGYNNDFTLIRSVRVTIIGRTTPSTDPTNNYRNPFDSGSYQIRGSSIVVDPRNLTMGND